MGRLLRFGRGRRRPASQGAAGDADEAFAEALYREYHDPLLRVVLRLNGGDRQWAEDVVQETLLRAWRSAGALAGEERSLMAWLSTVARRLVIDDWRRRTARPPEVGEEPLRNVAARDGWEPLLQSIVMGEALKELSESHREILRETFFRDRTVNQAAEALGIPVGTVKSRVYYALRALRVILEERGVTA
ncbi:sigma-70 family RNA polymerase sigma factor [Bailinhaonella thermotolerans]|uniref:RNA polymerase sigma factor n=1 Tax=Bailinhaonella thermotolerans TaxID=1070861 RepID=A0A3A4B387_9ACTN|nr:sigma-70 family RNA polymerase sigma factor [Bailinhaonella thermotolerans]